jgi:hypothetical protein
LEAAYVRTGRETRDQDDRAVPASHGTGCGSGSACGAAACGGGAARPGGG